MWTWVEDVLYIKFESLTLQSQTFACVEINLGFLEPLQNQG